MLEGLDGHVGAGAVFVLTVFHFAEGAVGVGLDSQLEGFADGPEGDLHLPVADACHGAVAAVSAFLRLDIRLGHVSYPAGYLSDGELVLHVAVAFAGPSDIFHRVKDLMQTEAFAKAGNNSAAARAVQPAGDQDSLRRSLVGIRHREFCLSVGDLCDHAVAVRRLFGGDDFLFLSDVGLHGIPEERIGIIIGGRAVEERALLGADHLSPVRKLQCEGAVRHGAVCRNGLSLRCSGHFLCDNDLFFGDKPSCFCVHGGYDDGKIAIDFLPGIHVHAHFCERCRGRAYGLRCAVVPAEGQFVAVRIRKSGSVEQLKGVSGDMRYPDGAVDEPDDLRADGRRAVRVEHAVHTEVPVMAPLAVVAAVGIAAVLVKHRVIDHFPDTAAHQAVVLIDFLPVGLRIAGADAHGVGVFAHKVRPVIQPFLLAAFFPDIVDHLHAGVHLAAHVVGLPLAVDGALVVHRKVGMLLQIAVHHIRVVVAAGFISQAPHNDGRISVNLVALVQAGDAIQVVLFPLGVMADGVVGRRDLVGKGAVGLQVVFVHNVDAQLVRQLQQQRIGRIVRGPDHIDIEFLAEQDIAFDLIGRHGVSVRRTGVVMVHPVEFQLPAVDQEDIPADLHRAETDLFLHAGGDGLVINVVQNGIFRVPFCDVQIVKGHSGQIAAVRLFFGCRRGGFLQAVPFQREGHIGPGEGAGRQLQRITIRCFFRFGVDIREIRRLADPQQHIPEDTVVPEHVLILQIGTVAPAVHDHQDLILPLQKLSAEIKFRGVVRALGIADEHSVQVEIHTAGDAHEGDDHVLCLVFNIKISAVDPDEIVFLSGILIAEADPLVASHPGKNLPDLIQRGDDRRLVGELVADIGVEGLIVPPELPAGGHIDGIEGDLLRIQNGGKLRRSGIELKIPDSVQALHLLGGVALLLGSGRIRLRPVRVGDKVGPPRQFVYFKGFKRTIVFGVD